MKGHPGKMKRKSRGNEGEMKGTSRGNEADIKGKYKGTEGELKGTCPVAGLDGLHHGPASPSGLSGYRLTRTQLRATTRKSAAALRRPTSFVCLSGGGGMLVMLGKAPLHRGLSARALLSQVMSKLGGVQDREVTSLAQLKQVLPAVVHDRRVCNRPACHVRNQDFWRNRPHFVHRDSSVLKMQVSRRHAFQAVWAGLVMIRQNPQRTVLENVH